LPPSIHPSGVPYAWADGLELGQVPLAPLPPWLLEVLRAMEQPASHETGGIIAREPHAYGDAALAAEYGRVALAQRGTRNHTLNLAAFKLGQLVAGGVLAEESARSALMRAAYACGLVKDDGEQHALATVISGLEAGKKQP